MWLMMMLACAEEEAQGVTTVVGTALDVVEFEVICGNDRNALEIPGLMDRGTPVTLQAYYLDDAGEPSAVVSTWDVSDMGILCFGDPGRKVRVIATYPSEE